jgi:hypothetical protein
MREIKFRAWDISRGEWFTDWENPNRSDWTQDDGHKELSMTSSDGSIILEQYTGLHDKNGREIYEGDILRDQYGNVGPCYWAPSSWEFLNTDGCVESGDPWEVVGNIHENAEVKK